MACISIRLICATSKELTTMSDQTTCKYFLSYSGVKLPLKLVGPMEESEVGNRNTYYRGYYDAQDRLIRCEKLVYDEVEMEHRYSYYDNGMLCRAEITVLDETDVIDFDENGMPS
jgi:hypothetical protein